jgi:hypothetical protein
MKMHSLRPTLDEAFEIFGDKCEFVVAAPQYRAVANTAMGWIHASQIRGSSCSIRYDAGPHRISTWSRSGIVQRPLLACGGTVQELPRPESPTAHLLASLAALRETYHSGLSSGADASAHQRYVQCGTGIAGDA